MDINENHGQVNVNCDVVNEGAVKLPLRPDAPMRECPICVALSPIYAPQCTNCTSDFEQHRLHLVHQHLERQLAEKRSLQDKMLIAFLGFCAIGVAGFFVVAEFGLACGAVAFFMMRAVGDDSEIEALKAQIEEVRSRLWI